MKALTPLIFLALAIAPSIFAQVPEYGQCGGENWTGTITCVAGCTCQSQNAWYSQCLPESNPTTSPTPSSTPSAPSYTPSPSGFVHTSGTKFTLNSATYTVVGANSYWVGLTGLNISEMNAAFADMAKAGATTVRTWGFNEVTSPSGIYYQSWSGSNSTINTGSTGLENFDNVVAAAKVNGLRLIVTLTNNWSDYGGMDVYVNQILGSGQPHDYFYTNAQVIAAYQNYVHTFVSRYVDEPTIFAWELANEPRCAGSTSATSGTCTTQIITNWASNLSAYIKKIDSNHLVALGDEGFYNEPSAPTYPYQGGEGIDFNANLAISTLDFGTFHSYPLSWGQTSDPGDWGVQWIKDHVTSQNAYGKPVIMEEFGVTTNQTSVYTSWYETVVDSGLTGVLIWQAGSYLPSGTTPNDGFTIYPDSPVYQLELQYAAALKARD